MSEQLVTTLANIDRRLICIEGRLSNIELKMEDFATKDEFAAFRDDMYTKMDGLENDILNKIDWLALHLGIHENDITHLKEQSSTREA